MQHHNVVLYNVLDAATSDEAKISFARTLANIGVAVSYRVWDDTLQRYNQSVSLNAFADFSSEDVSEGRVDVSSKGAFVFSSTDLLTASVTPAEKDSITYAGKEYAISEIFYYARNNISASLIDSSYAVQVKVLEKRAMTRTASFA